jgi:hypothetical protein
MWRGRHSARIRIWAARCGLSCPIVLGLQGQISNPVHASVGTDFQYRPNEVIDLRIPCKSAQSGPGEIEGQQAKLKPACGMNGMPTLLIIHHHSSATKVFGQVPCRTFAARLSSLFS